MLFLLLLIAHFIWIVGIQTFGLFLIPKKYWYTYTLSCLLVCLHWVVFDNKCILSILENKFADKKNENEDSKVYDYIEDLTKIPIPIQKRFQHTIMTINFLIVAYTYRHDIKIVLACMLCLYLNRWSIWSKFFQNIK